MSRVNSSLLCSTLCKALACEHQSTIYFGDPQLELLVDLALWSESNRGRCDIMDPIVESASDSRLALRDRNIEFPYPNH